MTVTPLLRTVDPLGLYFRAGRNDHRTLMQLMARGAPPFTGAVLDASLASRQDDLRLDLNQRRFETVLDPMVMELATEGGWEREALRSLSWAGDSKHTPASVTVANIGALIDPIAEFAVEKGYSAILSPTHYIEGIDDPWWPIDLAASRRLRQQLNAAGRADMPIYYRIATARRTLTEPKNRRWIAERLAGLEIDGLWLCVHPVGAQASGAILKSYIDFCRDLARVGVPLVAERTGFLGLALLGFNAVGGVESGITLGESFDAIRLIRPPERRTDAGGFSLAPRVYIDRLGTFLSRKEAKVFFAERGMRQRFACQDRPCCQSPDDMVKDPRRHLLHTRSGEVTQLTRVPAHNRPPVYLDTIRRASDDAMHAARIFDKFEKDQRRLGTWREVLASIVDRREYLQSAPAIPHGRLQRRMSA